MRVYLRTDLTFADPERFNFNANVAIKSRTNQLQVIAPLSSAADDCFPRARLQPPRKKTTSCGVFRHVLFPQMFSVGRVIAVPGVSHLPPQTTKIESQNQVFNYNRIELFGFMHSLESIIFDPFTSWL